MALLYDFQMLINFQLRFNVPALYIVAIFSLILLDYIPYIYSNATRLESRQALQMLITYSKYYSFKEGTVAG